MRINQDNYVALYCSKLENGRITIEEQLLHLKRYCKHFGFHIVQEYIDIDNVNKPYFSQMVEDIKKFKYDIVISYDFDTIGKQMADLLIKRINKPYSKCQRLISKPKFIIRESIVKMV